MNTETAESEKLTPEQRLSAARKSMMLVMMDLAKNEEAPCEVRLNAAIAVLDRLGKY